jgi:hypothetical protein
MTFPYPLDRSQILRRGSACAECRRLRVVSILLSTPTIGVMTSVFILILPEPWLACRNATVVDRSARHVLIISANARTASSSTKPCVYKKESANWRPSYGAANAEQEVLRRRRGRISELTTQRQLSRHSRVLPPPHIRPSQIIRRRLRTLVLL